MLTNKEIRPYPNYTHLCLDKIEYAKELTF